MSVIDRVHGVWITCSIEFGRDGGRGERRGKATNKADRIRIDNGIPAA